MQDAVERFLEVQVYDVHGNAFIKPFCPQLNCDQELRHTMHTRASRDKAVLCIADEVSVCHMVDEPVSNQRFHHFPYNCVWANGRLTDTGL